MWLNRLVSGRWSSRNGTFWAPTSIPGSGWLNPSHLLCWLIPMVLVLLSSWLSLSLWSSLWFSLSSSSSPSLFLLLYHLSKNHHQHQGSSTPFLLGEVPGASPQAGVDPAWTAAAADTCQWLHHLGRSLSIEMVKWWKVAGKVLFEKGWQTQNHTSYPPVNQHRPWKSPIFSGN